MGYREIRSTSCVSFVVASESCSQRVLTTKLTQRVFESYFAVTHEETPLCELFITNTYSKSSWYGSSFGRKMTTKHIVFGDSLVTLYSRMCTTRNKSHFQSIHIRCIYVSCLKLLTQTNKRQRTHVGNSVYKCEGERISVHCSVRCIRTPSDEQRLEKPAKQHIQPNSENV